MRAVAFDTAGPVIGVAACRDGAMAERSLRVARGAEAAIPALLAEVLDEVALGVDEIQLVVVADGPGAFTGLRVGVAAATGLATALGVPVVTVGSLVGRALAEGAGDRVVLALLDARKGRLYAQAWAADGSLLFGPVDHAASEVLAHVAPPFVATGEGALVARVAVERAGGVVSDQAAAPGVVALLREGVRKFAAGEGRDAVDVVPTYVREPDVGG